MCGPQDRRGWREGRRQSSDWEVKSGGYGDQSGSSSDHEGSGRLQTMNQDGNVGGNKSVGVGGVSRKDKSQGVNF